MLSVPPSKEGELEWPSLWRGSLSADAGARTIDAAADQLELRDQPDNSVDTRVFKHFARQNADMAACEAFAHELPSLPAAKSLSNTKGQLEDGIAKITATLGGEHRSAAE
jgi:hypothetical protein